MAPRTARREESAYRESRRDELLSVCAELIARKGFAKTTVRDIGDASGLLSGSLYYYFESKEAILEQLLGKLLDFLWDRYEQVAASDESPKGKLEGVVRVSLEAIDRYTNEVRIFQNETQFLAENDRFRYTVDRSRDFQAMVTSFLTEGIAAGQFRSDLRADVAFRFIRDSVWPVVHWYRPGGELTIEEVAEDYLSMLFDGLAEPSGS